MYPSCLRIQSSINTCVLCKKTLNLSDGTVCDVCDYNQSPNRCMDCNGAVPLHRLNLIEYDSILYCSSQCEQIYTICGVIRG